MYHLRVPQTAEELELLSSSIGRCCVSRCISLKGSERDAKDAMAHHQMVVDGRATWLPSAGYINAENEASIRFMAVPSLGAG